jgi:hypothetical protein
MNAKCRCPSMMRMASLDRTYHRKHNSRLCMQKKETKNSFQIEDINTQN